MKGLPDKERCLTDLGYFAREVLGMDYWRHWKTGAISRGGFEWNGEKMPDCGVASWGPHKEMVDFISQTPEEAPDLLVLCSRGSLKTTIIQAKIIQDILKDPNIRILIGMEITGNAELMIETIMRHFESNEILRELFGDFVGDKWSKKGLVVSKRTQTSLRDPTLAPFGTDKVITGGHFDRCYYDDPVSWQQALSVDQMKKAIRCYEALVPIMDPGSQMVITMTPYDEQDLSHHVRNELGSTFQVLKLDCGMVATGDGRGGYELVGEPRFPHLPVEWLQAKLDKQGPREFNSQYAMRIDNPDDQLFHREQFGIATWQERFRHSNAYMLTDTATTDKEHGCFSVVGLVILDHDDTAYLADLRIGRWNPDQYVQEFAGVLEEWRTKTRLIGCAMEKIGLNRVYRVPIEEELRRRGLSVRFIDMPRGRDAGSKNQRIRSLQSRFCSGRFKVLPSVPRTYVDRGMEKILWEPHGFVNQETQRILPDGELVNQFIRFRDSGGDQVCDVPDAIADLEAVDQRGKRYLWPSAPNVAREFYDRSNSGQFSHYMQQRKSRESFWERAANRRKSG